MWVHVCVCGLCGYTCVWSVHVCVICVDTCMCVLCVYTFVGDTCVWSIWVHVCVEVTALDVNLRDTTYLLSNKASHRSGAQQRDWLGACLCFPELRFQVHAIGSGFTWMQWNTLVPARQVLGRATSSAHIHFLDSVGRQSQAFFVVVIVDLFGGQVEQGLYVAWAGVEVCATTHLPHVHCITCFEKSIDNGGGGT